MRSRLILFIFIRNCLNSDQIGTICTISEFLPHPAPLHLNFLLDNLRLKLEQILFMFLGIVAHPGTGGIDQIVVFLWKIGGPSSVMASSKTAFGMVGWNIWFFCGGLLLVLMREEIDDSRGQCNFFCAVEWWTLNGDAFVETVFSRFLDDVPGLLNHFLDAFHWSVEFVYVLAHIFQEVGASAGFL